MDFLLLAWFGKPLWMWLGFLAVIIALLVFDLGVLHRKDHEIAMRESLLLSAFYISLGLAFGGLIWWHLGAQRSEEHTSELQSLMRISYAVFCLKKKNTITQSTPTNHPLLINTHE